MKLIVLNRAAKLFRKRAIPFLSACVATAGIQAAITDGLVAYWPLDVNNGGITPDAVYTNNMSVVGNPAIVPGQAGNAFTFDGTSTYLTNLHSVDNSLSG